MKFGVNDVPLESMPWISIKAKKFVDFIYFTFNWFDYTIL